MRINSKFLRLPQVIDRTGYRKTAIYERIQQGDFPRPVKLGPRAVGWLDTEVRNGCAAVSGSVMLRRSHEVRNTS